MIELPIIRGIKYKTLILTLSTGKMDKGVLWMGGTAHNALQQGVGGP